MKKLESRSFKWLIEGHTAFLGQSGLELKVSIFQLSALSMILFRLSKLDLMQFLSAPGVAA